MRSVYATVTRVLINLNKVWRTVRESGGEISPERAKEDETGREGVSEQSLNPE